MYDLESINADQLVTRTDLVLCGNFRNYRKAALARGSKNFTIAARAAVEQRVVATGGELLEHTTYVRAPEARPFYMLCAVTTIAWLCVAAVCLLA